MRKWWISFLLFVFASMGTLGFQSGTALACGFGICDPMMDSSMGMFYGQPYFSSGGWFPGPATGQMPQAYADLQNQMIQAQLIAASQQMNWSGYSPFGFGGAYTPPIGLSAVFNTVNYNSFAGSYGAR